MGQITPSLPRTSARASGALRRSCGVLGVDGPQDVGDGVEPGVALVQNEQAFEAARSTGNRGARVLGFPVKIAEIFQLGAEGCD